MGDRLVGCASYTMSEFHVRNYMARRPHINQEPNVGTSAVANMCAELIECHTSGQTKEEYLEQTSKLCWHLGMWCPVGFRAISRKLVLIPALVAI